MSEQSGSSMSSKLFPTLRYQDAPAAIDWLAEAFGMEKQMVISSPDGTIAHAQLKFGEDMIMLGSSRDDGLKLKVCANWGESPRAFTHSFPILTHITTVRRPPEPKS